jgi:hypothetical protein
MQVQSRRLVRHFIRGYLSVDFVGGERQAALSAAVLVSPGLFATVLLTAKYVMTPFPVPGLSALGGFADRLLIFCASMVTMGLVAVVQWERLALDARDANILGVLPLQHGQIVRAKWIATGLFAGTAAVMFNALPSLIYPVVSVGRLEASWALILQLTLLQFTLGVVAGLLGFLSVLALREGLWAVLGAARFARVSAAAQAALVVLGVLAFFLLPTQASRAVRERHGAARWLPPVVVAGALEELAGHRVASLPAPALPRRVAQRAGDIVDEYHRSLTHVRGSARRMTVAIPGLCAALLLVLLWNNRRRLEAPVLQGRGTDLGRTVARGAWRALAPRPEVRAGATFAWRTLLRSQPHRLRLAVGLAAGLAAATLGMVDVALDGVGPATAETTPFILSMQAVILAGVAAGVRAALRRSADARAAWLFTTAWTGDRSAYDTGVTLAAWLLLAPPVLLLAPIWRTLLGDSAVAHAAVGLALGLALAQFVVLTLGTLALVNDAVPSEAGRALPVLAVPVVLMVSTVIAAVEGASAIATVGVLVALAGCCHGVRLRRRTDDAPPGAARIDAQVALDLHD